MRNEETVKYLNIMIESLEKKTSLLEQLHKKTVLQSECIAGKDSDDANWEQFDVLIVEKDSLIERIDELDMGFDNVFNRIKFEVEANKEDYKDEIHKLQALIGTLTDTGVKIGTAEERNRKDVDRIMTAVKAGIGKARKNMKASSGYIASMYGNQAAFDSTKIDSKH